MDWSFWQWLGAALALVVAAIGIKFAFTFDLNRHLEGRRERSKARLKALCPHTELRFLQSGEILAESHFQHVGGSFALICSQCGLEVTNENLALRIAQDWVSNPDGWKKADKRFRKEYSKFYEIYPPPAPPSPPPRC